jgi:rhodanese-related sulfurtransferase
MESVSQQLKNRQDITLVDVRDAGEFEKFRIPGSINIPLFALKTKIFLKSKPLVLINEGHNYQQLTDEGAVLSKAGFIVSILDGGLYQWKRKNGPLEGDVFAQKELNYISPQRLSVGKSRENWIVIDVSKNAAPVSLKPDKTGKGSKTATGNKNARIETGLISIGIPFAEDPKEFVQKLKLAIKNHKEKDLLSVLICDENGKTYDEIEKHLQTAGIQNVLYVEGGLGAYKTFEQQQIKMAQAKTLAETVKNSNTNKKGCTTGCP